MSEKDLPALDLSHLSGFDCTVTLPVCSTYVRCLHTLTDDVDVDEVRHVRGGAELALVQPAVRLHGRVEAEPPGVGRPPVVVEHLHPVARRVQEGVHRQELGVAVAEPRDLRTRIKKDQVYSVTYPVQYTEVELQFSQVGGFSEHSLH